MRKLFITLTICFVIPTVIECSESTGGDAKSFDVNHKLNITALDLQDDIYFLMGMDYVLFQEIVNQDAIDIYEQNSEERMNEHYYQFKNGVDVNISHGHVISAGTYYYDDSLRYPVPTILGINGEDDYESVVRKLGTPYYDDPYSNPPSIIYSVSDNTYIKMFFDSETRKVSYADCFKE